MLEHIAIASWYYPNPPKGVSNDSETAATGANATAEAAATATEAVVTAAVRRLVVMR